jgi:hypothetical protein
MSLSSKNTLVFGFVLILILVAIILLVLRLLKLQTRVTDLERAITVEKQKAWLQSKQLAEKKQAPDLNLTTVRNTVLDVLMEIENLKNGVNEANDANDANDANEANEANEAIEEEEEEESGENIEEDCDSDQSDAENIEDNQMDPRARPFSILTSLFSGVLGGEAKKSQGQKEKTQFVEIFE